MDWEVATRVNREALLRFAARLFAMLGIAPGESAGRVPPPLYRAALALLKPL